MLFALGAVSSALNALQSITSKSSSAPSSGSGQAAANPFEIPSGSGRQAGTVPPTSGSTNGISQISPQTMSALLAAQSQSTNSTGSTSSASSDPLQKLFALIDGNGDGNISKAEFEKALGAGGTNLANADSVFAKLDKNGDGNVSPDEMKSALQGGHHHHHVASSGGAGDGGGSSGSGDPLAQALAGASSTSVTNADGSKTTSLTYADGSQVSMTTAASSTASSSATSSYNFVEKLIQREAQAVSSNTTNSLAISA